MKKFLLLAFVAATLATTSCNVSQKVQTYFHEKCPDSKIQKQSNGTYLVKLQCKDLYDATELKKYLSEGTITYDVVNAELVGTVTSKDSIPNMYGVLVSIYKGVKKK
jgi:hypothetical protein